MTRDQMFLDLIRQPLQKVVGKQLHHVRYWILDFEVSEFLVNRPNLTGLYAISITYADTTLEIGLDSKTLMREENAYHIETRLVDINVTDAKPQSRGLLVEINADKATPWNLALREQLLSADVYGFGSSPQLICFIFPSVTAVIAIGTSAVVPYLGDGDELLVFVSDEWTTAKKTLLDPLVKLLELSINMKS